MSADPSTGSGAAGWGSGAAGWGSGAAAGWSSGAAGFDDIAAALAAAEDAVRPAERYLAAHRAALRVAAGVLARRRPRLRERIGIWVLLARVAPELAEWADYFAMIQLKVRAVEAGAVGIVSTREADDLVRDAHAFARATHA